MADFFIAHNGKQTGPYSIETISGLIAQGRLHATVLVWTEGMPEWAPISIVLPTLFPTSSSPRPISEHHYGNAAQKPNISAKDEWRVAASSSSFPSPPSYSLALVVLMTIVTCGAFGLVWMFVLALFAKKLDPRDSSVIAVAVSSVFWLLNILLTFVLSVRLTPAEMMICPLLHWGIGLVGIFMMRRTFEDHYSKAEPIGLKLDPILTFFFQYFYFQYHLQRIAVWKKTGHLD